MSEKYIFLNDSFIIDSLFNVNENEKDKYAEFNTNYTLRKEILDVFILHNPTFFKNPSIKIFEPTCGKGGFVIDLIKILMESLKDIFIDENLRYKHILENMIYFCDINHNNIEFIKNIINPLNKYSLNCKSIDTLKLNTNDVFNVSHFDMIIGNPPFNPERTKKHQSNTIWLFFVDYSLKLLKENGYLIFITPILWRKIFKPNSTSKVKHLYKELTQKRHLIYLKMIPSKMSIKYFNANVKCDYYIVKNTLHNDISKIIDIDNVENNINLLNYPFIPNGSFKLIYSLLRNDNTINNNFKDYHSKYKCKKKNQKILSNTKDDIFKYKLLKRSNTKLTEYIYTSLYIPELFECKKVLFNICCLASPVIDFKGEIAPYAAIVIYIFDDDKIGQSVYDFFKKHHHFFKKYLTYSTFVIINVDYFFLIKDDFYKYNLI